MFKILKTNKNKFFTPSVLLFLVVCIYFFTAQNFAERNYQYAYILAITGIFLAIKIFFLAFLQLEKYIVQKKWISLVVELILVGAGWSLIFSGVNHLSQDKFPDVTIWFLFLANLSFLMQLFLARLLPYKTTIFTILLYLFFLLMLNRKWFINGDQILSQQFIAYSLLFLEVFLFLFIARITIKDLKSG